MMAAENTGIFNAAQHATVSGSTLINVGGNYFVRQFSCCSQLVHILKILVIRTIQSMVFLLTGSHLYLL